MVYLSANIQSLAPTYLSGHIFGKIENEQLYYKDYFQLKMGQSYQVQYFSVDSLLSLNEINMRLKTLILFLEHFKKYFRERI